MPGVWPAEEMAGLGQQTVEFSTLVRRAAEDSFLSLKELVERSAGQSDSEKKISLLKYINRTRQRMLRLHVLAKWCQQVRRLWFSLLLPLRFRFLCFVWFFRRGVCAGTEASFLAELDRRVGLI